jgi:hypothetical protein
MASRSKTVVRQKYVARQPTEDEDNYFNNYDDNFHGDFSEFEGKGVQATLLIEK